MPGIAEGIYAQYYDSVIKMSKRPGGVSRPEIMKGLAVTRPAADRLIDECHLKRSRTEGRTNFFKPTKATDKVLDGTESGNPSEATDIGEDKDHMDQHTPGEQALLNALVSDDPLPQGQTQQALAPVNRVATLTVPAATAKTAEQLDTEIKALKSAIDSAEEKASNGHKTYVVQQAHANALGQKLQRVLSERLAL